MKSILTGFGGVLTLFFVILIQATILNFGIRQNELDTAMNNAMIETQRVLYEQKEAFYDNNNDNIADSSMLITDSESYKDVFVKNLMQYIDSNSDIEIYFYTADNEKGLLDVKAVANYTNLVGKNRAYESRRTSILDSIENYNVTITFDIANVLEVDMSDTRNYIDRNTGKGTIDIKIISGTVTGVSVDKSDVNVSYAMDGDILRIQLDNVQSDIKVTVSGQA